MENNQPATPANDPATINAIVDTLGGLVMCLAKQMQPDARSTLARDLAQLSANATAQGNTLTGRLMSDISRAAQL